MKEVKEYGTSILPVKEGNEVREWGRENLAKLKLPCLSFEHLANCSREAQSAYAIRIETSKSKAGSRHGARKTNETHDDPLCVKSRPIVQSNLDLAFSFLLNTSIEHFVEFLANVAR